MKCSIQISRRAIKALAYEKSGKGVSVKAYYTHPLPDECMMNGVIIDAAPIIEGLGMLKRNNPKLFKEASLVIDGSFVYSKRVTVPGKMNAVMYDNVIRGEFADVSQDNENLLCSYYPLTVNPDGSKVVLACGVEYAHAEAYLSLFNAAGINLASVHLGMQTILNFISKRSELSRAPFVLNVVDDVIMLSMIFQDGISVFQSRTRLYGETHLALVRSTLDSLSGIIQFNKSQNFADITYCCYAGLSDADMQVIAANNDYPDISFATLDVYKGATGADKLPPDAYFAYLGAMMPDKAPDLFTSINTLEKARKAGKPKKVAVPIVISLAAVIAIALAGLFYFVYVTEKEASELRQYLDSPDVVAMMAEINLLSSETYHINSLSQAVQAKSDELKATPQVSRELLQTIVSTGGQTVRITGIGFSSNSGTVSVSATSLTEYFAAQYVEKLKSEPLIDTVYYTSYTTNTDGEQLFSIDVVKTGWREEAEQE